MINKMLKEGAVKLKSQNFKNQHLKLPEIIKDEKSI